LLYNFCVDEKIMTYLKKWSWPWYLVKKKSIYNLSHIAYVPLEIINILSDASLDAMEKKLFHVITLRGSVCMEGYLKYPMWI
jgi:hypothetical protein